MEKIEELYLYVNQQQKELDVLKEKINRLEKQWDLKNKSIIVLFVYFATDIKVPVKKAREYVAHMDEGGITHAIVVYSSQITSGASNEFYETDKIQ